MTIQICSCPIHRAKHSPINWATTIVVLVLLFCLPVHAKDEKPKLFKVPSGANISSLGLAIDVSYDPNTDNIVPGYKILNVAIANSSINILQLNAVNDEWLVVDIKKHKHNAINSLKDTDPDTYLKLPPKLRRLIDYPSMVQVGETRQLDLLFKDNVELDAFKMVKYTSASTKKSIEITAQDD